MPDIYQTYLRVKSEYVIENCGGEDVDPRLIGGSKEVLHFEIEVPPNPTSIEYLANEYHCCRVGASIPIWFNDWSEDVQEEL